MKALKQFFLPLAISLSAGFAAARQTPCQLGWQPTFGGGLNDHVNSLGVFDDGSGGGPALYAGGIFTGAGGVPGATRIAKWDGSSWSPLGSGMNGSVEAMIVFDDGSGNGPALYAGGSFTSAGGVSANHIAKWDGSSWSTLGGGVGGGGNNTCVNALAVFDDQGGGGPALYVGGDFLAAGQVHPARRIAKWDGSSWSAVGSGMTFDGIGEATVYSLTVFDDGSGEGPALYAGGRFNGAGGVSASYIAKWNGSAWSALESGMNSFVLALEVFDDGSGPALFAGGIFTNASGNAANFIAKWNGSTWSALGFGLNSIVLGLTVFDDGSGPALHAGGIFTLAGGISANRVAKWNGSSWSPLASGVSSSVRALTVLDDGSGGGPALYAGGDFTSSPSGDQFLAKWGCPSNPCPPFSIALNNGTGINPACFSIPVGPIIGASMEMTVDGTFARDVRWSSVEGRQQGGSLVTPFAGELLLNRQSALFHKSIAAGSGLMSHSFFIDPALLGQSMVFQGWLGFGDARIQQYCNAFDLIPGCQ